MYVEFIGIPGAGKTTLVGEVKELLEREGKQCATRATFFSKNRTWKYKFIWMLLHPQYLDFSIVILLIKLSRAKGSTLKDLIIRINEHQKLQYKLAHHRGKIVLWDAGYVQRLSNLVMKNILDKIAVTELIYKRIPKESLLIFVDTPTDVTVVRMKEREPTRKVDGLHKLQAQTRQAQQTTLAILSTKSIATFRVDGTKSIAENANIVFEYIKKQI